MQVTIIKESGFNESIIGISLSYNVNIERAMKASCNLYNKERGENKFLESIMVWLDVTAPRFWWAEADTYRISSKQSESTMHTISKHTLTQDDFEYNIDVSYLQCLNLSILAGVKIDHIKNALPEGFLQRRIWCMNYKTLRNIIHQRHNHRLPQWKYFCAEIMNQIEHKEYFRDIILTTD
jgi:thymidylate synthase ThyX